MSYPSDWVHVTLHISPDYQEIHFDGNKDLGNQIVDAWKSRAVLDIAKGEIDAGVLAKAAKAAYEATKAVDMAPWDWDGPGSEAIREVYRKAARAVLAVGKGEMLAGLRERILPLLGQAIGYGEAHPVYSERAYHNGRVSAFEEVLVWLTEEAKRDERSS